MFKKLAHMGLLGSKPKRRIDEATSNSSLSNLRYVVTERPKWKVFHKKEVVAVPAYQTRTLKPMKGCPCGNNGPCKQRVTPKGVTIHYPQKKKRFGFTVNKSIISPKPDKGFYSNNPRPTPKVKVIRQRKFPTWRLDKIHYRPALSISPRPFRKLRS
ncbi:uncharacterized protein [Epargyreus clarus]|uniref:uncharacterized protein n=1 Tax=Epargyreus clarus TaxID=520877 RepID=UPI003C2F547D